ncbi:thioredoxin domain-containing protein [Methanobacterium sp. ACI-7]|uniref:thioredoxin domain-containing protein n=1 Tax=unclassified Methanobacterium TaxID=2627676 RepID=UPI0039C18EAD
MSSGNDNPKYKNHLANEKSPYLIQHVNNPVDWYPWSDEAFQKAKEQNKPIFLSIGYSTCHWCHVMAHESFEDPEIGKLMNDTFVSIKVDREERPDLDNIYMAVCQLMTGSGGWPLTIIMTPNKEPFFAGTYFAPESGYGRPGLKDIINSVKEAWNTKQDEITKSTDSILNALKQVSETSSGDELSVDILDECYEVLLGNFDGVYGGFGKAPKFPSSHNLLFLLRYWKRSGLKFPLSMITETLDSMRNGGIYDHIGFGFHRYSVDQEWLVPHFEKMLYDQAMISMAYVETFQATKNERYKNIALEIFEYVIRDMQSSEGGFYSAEDADSEGVEGKFYVWTKDEIMNVLGPDDGKLALRVYNITEQGNFLEEATGEETGANILHLQNSIEDIAEISHISEENLEEKMEEIRKNLFEHREKRVHPHKDDKILTDWNGLMIASLAKGAEVLNEETLLKSAKNAADFIINSMCKDNHLMHRFREGESAIKGHLDDYAFMIYGLLELYEASFDLKYLKSALSLNETLLKHFWDNEDGGFYFTPDYAEDVLLRKKEIYDGAIPSGNSIQYLNLLKIAQLTENKEFKDKALQLEKAFSKTIKNTPSGFTGFLCGLDFRVGPSYEIVIAGNKEENETKSLVETVWNNYIPNKTLILRSEDNVSELIDAIPSAESKKIENNKATAYVCSEGSCKNPTNDLDTFLNNLNIEK